MPAGLSSLVLQSQAVFTVSFAAVLLRERPAPDAGRWPGRGDRRPRPWSAGASDPTGRRSRSSCVLGAAAAWGVANVAIRRAAPPDMLSFIVWVSVVAAPVLAALTLAVDGPVADLAALRSLDRGSVMPLIYIAGLSTLAGWGVWGLLIRRYGASTVAPFSMLVPFFGLASGAVVLGEAVHTTDLIGGALVVGGVLTGVLAHRYGRSAHARGPSSRAEGPSTASDAVGPDAAEPERQMAARHG